MVNDILYRVGTQIQFRNSTDFSPTTGNNLAEGTPTQVQLDLTSLGDAAARSSAKVDLGATRASLYSVDAAFEWSIAPTSENFVELYWAPSHSVTAGNANPGYVSGSDAAYTGTPATLAEAVKQLEFLGVVVVSADAVVQKAHVGIFTPSHRYGSLVVKNESGSSFIADGVEMNVVLTPIITQVQ